MNPASICATLAELAKAHPDKTAIANEVQTASFRELAELAHAIKTHFETNAPRRLAIYLALPSGPDFAALQAGIMDSGHVAVPIPPKSTAAESTRYFAVLKPDLVCVNSTKETRGIIEALPASARILAIRNDEPREGTRPVVGLNSLLSGLSALAWDPSPGPASLPADAAMIQFTSGSTGFPKGIVLGVQQLLASNKLSHDHLAGFRGEQIFVPVPQFHAMGNALVFEHVLAGCEVHLANGVLPGEHLLRMMAKNIHAINANPTYFRILLQLESFSPQKLPRLQHFMMGSDWIDSSLLGSLRSRFPHAHVHCRYGLSEAYGALAYQSIAPTGSMTEGSLGQFLPGVEAQLRPAATQDADQPAALWIKSPTMATEQLMAAGSLQPLTDAHGFLNTGDTVRRGEARWILAGRESQFIKVNGHRISPFEIEEALRNIPSVAEASVTGVPDPVTGQRIVACVAAQPGVTLAVDLLRKSCASQLSPYKIPQVFLLDFPVPKTAAGKVARARLAAMVADSLRGPK